MSLSSILLILTPILLEDLLSKALWDVDFVVGKSNKLSQYHIDHTCGATICIKLPWHNGWLSCVYWVAQLYWTNFASYSCSNVYHLSRWILLAGWVNQNLQAMDCRVELEFICSILFVFPVEALTEVKLIVLSTGSHFVWTEKHSFMCITLDSACFPTAMVTSRILHWIVR